VIILIEKDELIKFAKVNNLKPWQQEKHYLQTLVLMSLSEYNLAFKGGTYLWFFHGLRRFSEDLDFTFTDKIDKNMVEKVIEFLSYYDISAKIKIICDDKRSFSFRIDAIGPLSDNEQTPCVVYVEISKREKPILLLESYSLDTPVYKLPVKNILGFNLKEILAEKVRTVLKRDKARDVFDINFLIDNGIELDYNLIDEKLKYYKMKYNKDKFIAALKNKNNIYDTELKNLVIGNLPKFEEVIKKIESKFI